MKKKILVLYFFSLAFVSNSQTIDAVDTLVFDLSNASCSGSYFMIPVSFQSDDSVYAIDFSMKYNQSQISYDSILNQQQSILTTGSYYNPVDSTIRFTSSSMFALPYDTGIVSIRFSMIGISVFKEDFNTIHAYLNGDVCSYKIIPPALPFITPSSLTIFQGDSVSLTASSGIGFTYLWSTNDTAQTIYITTQGTYSVAVTTGGCTLIDSVNIVLSVPLPVEVLDFTAAQENNSVRIKWSTASENNNDYFEVERSVDAITWCTISKVNGAGNSSLENKYSTFDTMPLQGLKYYRLKQVDFDGTSVYYRPVALHVIKVKTEPVSIKVFPNPVINVLHFYTDENVSVQLFDIYGQQVLMPQHIVAGLNQQINIQQISSGMYTLKVCREHSDVIEKNISIVVLH